MKGAKPIMLLSATLLTISALAQQGVFYYVNTNAELINSKTTDVVLNDNGMVILNECSDAKYEKPAVQLIELNKSFIKTSENIVAVNNLHSVSTIAKYSNGNYGIFANANESPVKLNVSGSYKELNQTPLADQKDQTIVGKVIVDKQILVVSTLSASKDKYAIVLSSFDAATGDKQWSKIVSSETNESADAIVGDNAGSVVVLGRKYNDNATEYIPILYKLDTKGGIVWKKSGVDMPSNFYSQSLAVSANGDIFYACGLTQRSGMLQTKLIKLDANGNTKRNININEFTGNGVLSLSSGKILLYGSRFYTDSKQVVTKGAYVILDADLNELNNKSLGVNDKPDSDFNYNTTSSSDLQAALELESGSVVMVGKVTMPQAGSSSEKQNNTIVVVADAYGNYK
ncbi:MAG: hypothetical protein IKW77_07635 [Salinivirgaceae bacterium]|nr:hypothetical protein [Salinivirgaceae bacterium]